MRILRKAALVAATFLSGLGSAYACQGTTFLTPEQEQYNLRTDYTKTGPGQFNVTPAMNSWAPQALMVSDERTINLCATVTMLSTADQNDSGVGLLFWYNGQNFEDYYFVEIQPSGKYRFVHELFNKLYPLIPYTSSPAIKTGLNQPNELELRLGSGGADLYINGQMVNEILAHPAADAKYYGGFGDSPIHGTATMQIQAIRLQK